MGQGKQTWSQFLAVPRAFLNGLLGGLFGPVLALLGVVGMLYALTRQLPAIVEVTRGDEERHSAITLASQAEARASWVRFFGDLRAAMLELEARQRS